MRSLWLKMKYLRRFDLPDRDFVSVLKLVHPSRFSDPILLKFKEVTDANQRFYELKQCQRKAGSENRIV